MIESVRGIRGAIQVPSDEPEAVFNSTMKLLSEVLSRNGIVADKVISAMFTTTPDLHSAFPAEAARSLGFSDTPLICAQEIDVPGALVRVIRILLWVYTAQEKSEIQHVYLDGAEVLRKDQAQ
jgi:chorismate mutase